MPFLGVRIWFTAGVNGCDRCGAKDCDVAHPKGGAWLEHWCANCLRKTGR